MLVADFEQFDEQRLSVEQRCAIANADPAHNPNIGQLNGYFITRDKQENVLLIGLIPDPNRPDHDINSFLDPMVEELKKF